jgi:hypothetical protein
MVRKDYGSSRGTGVSLPPTLGPAVPPLEVCQMDNFDRRPAAGQRAAAGTLDLG